MTRDELQQRVWGMPYRHRDRTVDVCVRKVREKLDRRSASYAYLHTHYGVGYRFAAEPKGDAEDEPAA
jgi:DNA-binding response OmpR family regulator